MVIFHSYVRVSVVTVDFALLSRWGDCLGEAWNLSKTWRVGDDFSKTLGHMSLVVGICWYVFGHLDGSWWIYIYYIIYIFKIEWYVNVTMVCKVVQLQFLMAMIFAPRWDDEFAMNGDPAASAARCITHHNSSGRIHGQLQSPTPIEPWWPSVFR
jgi:hypothetical protein